MMEVAEFLFAKGADRFVQVEAFLDEGDRRDFVEVEREAILSFESLSVGGDFF